MIRIYRLPFLLFAFICLLIGLWTGLNRIGWNIPILPPTLHHGAIMVGGFLGTLIALEKIIPLKKKEFYIIPLTSAASIIGFFSEKTLIGFSFLLLASIGLILVFIKYFISNRNRIYLFMFLGAVCWGIGNLLLITEKFYPLVLPWWIAFIMLIISAERLEITRFLPVSNMAKNVLFVLLILFILGAALSFHGVGKIVSGLALVGISIWLMRYDIIGVTIRGKALTKFIAVTLLGGYIALLLTGLLFITHSNEWLAYDALVHTFFIGFVFSMIFAHGPVILPGVLGVSVKPFHNAFYIWLLILHCSWIIRLIADIHLLMEWRKISGMLGVVSITGYFVTLAVLTAFSLRNEKSI